MAHLIFDIETIPDARLGRRVFDLPQDLSDAAVIEAMQARRRADAGSDFQKHCYHQIVAIACVLDKGQELKVWSLGEPESTEADLIQRFFQGIAKLQPILVSWNGAGFDLPVLHYRALKHGIVATDYWEVGQSNNEFKWNNYLNRYHYRHLDLMDVLSGYQARSAAKLDEIATMLGLPGKMGMAGDKVLGAYQAGEIAQIRDYCETDVLNTYGVYLHFERMRGLLSQEAFEARMERLVEMLKQSDKQHWQAFVDAIEPSHV